MYRKLTLLSPSISEELRTCRSGTSYRRNAKNTLLAMRCRVHQIVQEDAELWSRCDQPLLSESKIDSCRLEHLISHRLVFRGRMQADCSSSPCYVSCQAFCQSSTSSEKLSALNATRNGRRHQVTLHINATRHPGACQRHLGLC